MDLPTVYKKLQLEEVEPKSGTLVQMSSGKFIEQGSLRFHALSDNTKRAYRRAIEDFLTRDNMPFPADASAISGYMELLASKHKLSLSSVQLKMSAVKYLHDAYEYPYPNRHKFVTDSWKGLKVLLGTKQKRAKPARRYEMMKVCDYLDGVKQSDKVVRDRALVMLGHMCLLRRSEIAELKRRNLEFTELGLTITLEKSKNRVDEEKIFVPMVEGIAPHYCTITLVKEWVARSERGDITSDSPVFLRCNSRGGIMWSQYDKHMSGDGINKLLKALFRACGMKGWQEYTSHTLRRGFATQANDDGINLIELKDAGRWKNLSTVLRYIEVTHSAAIGKMATMWGK